MVTKGQVVKIKPEWQDAGDDRIAFIAVDDEEKGRVTIEAQLENLTFKPQHVVLVDMLEVPCEHGDFSCIECETVFINQMEEDELDGGQR